jgi:hypothetical protein
VLKKIAAEGIVYPSHRTIRFPDQLWDNMEIPHGLKEAHKLSELLVHVYLPRVCLRQAFRVISIIFIRTIQHYVSVTKHPFFPNERSALIIPIKAQLILPARRAFSFSTTTFTAISVCWRAARHLIERTPPRRPIASRNPPPAEARSRRNRNISRKLDFPDALGPTRKTRLWRCVHMGKIFPDLHDDFGNPCGIFSCFSHDLSPYFLSCQYIPEESTRYYPFQDNSII